MGNGKRGGGGQPDWLGRVAGASHLGGAVMVRTLTDLRDGRVIWNGEVKTDSDALAAAIATGVDLTYANLRGANLRGADLRGADLSGADLSSADLSSANLRGADLSSANLRGADLSGADLSSADLSSANLRGADLRGAYLRGAYLRGADLSSADLSSANLRGADLSGANLSGANLRGANLSGAYLRGADLVPTMVLLANIGAVSNELCADLMAYDAANHPDPSAFGRWASGGECPYSGVRVGRVANFEQRKECWQEGRAVLSAFELMQRVLRETCADSDYHEKAVR